MPGGGGQNTFDTTAVQVHVSQVRYFDDIETLDVHTIHNLYINYCCRWNTLPGTLLRIYNTGDHGK